MKFDILDSKVLKVLFITGAILILSFAIITYFKITQMTTMTGHVSSHYLTKMLIEQSFSTFKDIESSTRGYVLTRDTVFLKIRSRSISRLPITLQSISRRVRNSDIQTYYFNKLNNLYLDRLYQSDNILLSRNRKELSSRLINSAMVMEECRILVGKMLKEEEKAIEADRSYLDKQVGNAPITFLVLIAFLILILVFNYFSISRQLKESKILQRNLEDSNTSLEIANQSLAKSQVFLKSVINNSPNGIITYEAVRDEQGKIFDFQITFSNNNLAVLRGKQPDEIIGKLASEVYPMLKSTGFYDHLIEVTETGISKFFQFNYPYDGNVGGWYDVSLTKLFDGVILNGRDISNIKKAEEDIKVNIELLNERNSEVENQKSYIYTVFNALLDCIITFDDQMQIVSANGMFYNVTKTDETIIGKKFDELFIDSSRPHVIDLLKRALQGEFIYDKNFFGPVSNKYFDNYLIPLKNNNGKIYGVVLISHDIDEQVKSQKEINNYIAELKKANEQLKQFSFVASHDLQEPLRKIQLFSNKLLDKYHDDMPLANDISKLRVEASRMSSLIIAFIKYSQLQVGKTALQWTDLNKLMQQVLIDMESIISEKNAFLEIDDLPVIKCDPSQISQLFKHIISNSIKFCNRKPVIKIECSRADDSSLLFIGNKSAQGFYRLRFIDNGIGFDNEYSDRIFLLFEKLHDSKLYQGVGIGLSLCQKIIENHKGKIAAFSRESEGSTFDVYLQEDLNL